MQNCLKCHDADSKKGDINLDHESIDWNNQEELYIWLRALHAIEQGLMPPQDQKQPSREDRRVVLAFLDKNLLNNIPIGGTLPRRLNKAEYEATIRNLLYLPDFKLPLGFPNDIEYHGFDNIGEGLVLSPPHLEA